MSIFVIFGHEFVGGYVLGSSKEALERYQISSLYIWDAVNTARSRNSTHFSLMEGEEPYKLRWNPKKVPHYRIVLGRSLVCWSPYAGYYVLRSRVVRYAKSDDAPRWVKGLLTTYWSLRYRAARYVQSENAPRRIKSVVANWFREG